MNHAGNDRSKGKHPIRVVALRTGLSPSVLRAWERRYGLVTPSRSEGGQRLYSDADLERLSLLNRATQGGRAISQVAPLEISELEALVSEDEAAARIEVSSRRRQRDGGLRGPLLVDHEAVAEAMRAVESLDSDRLEVLLRRAAVEGRATGVIERLFVPLLRQIGDRWQEGTLRPRHEHLATSVLRRVIEWLADAVRPAERIGRIVIGTPVGELHEIGAMLAAVASASEAWEVTFLGSNVPVDDIVGAAHEVEASAVGLSIVNPADAGRLGRFVVQVRQQLPESTTLILGGASAGILGVALDRPGVVRVGDLTQFRSVLSSLRSTAPAN